MQATFSIRHKKISVGQFSAKNQLPQQSNIIHFLWELNLNWIGLVKIGKKILIFALGSDTLSS